MESERDRDFMQAALGQARLGAAAGEVPVGAVVVMDDEVVGMGHNMPILLNDPTAHAEIVALRAATQVLKSYRLPRSSLYVTIEPCVMCIGAIVNARVARLYFGARDDKAGAVGSVYDIGRDGRLNHRVEVYPGVMEPECSALMQEFFASRRARSSDS